MQALKTKNGLFNLVSNQLRITNGFKCFLIVEQNPLIIISAILSTMP